RNFRRSLRRFGIRHRSPSKHLRASHLKNRPVRAPSANQPELEPGPGVNRLSGGVGKAQAQASARAGQVASPGAAPKPAVARPPPMVSRPGQANHASRQSSAEKVLFLTAETALRRYAYRL